MIGGYFNGKKNSVYSRQYFQEKAVRGMEKYLKKYVGEVYKVFDEEKHKRNAKIGWYRYDTYFAIPVHASDGEVDHYNMFYVSLLICHSEDGKKYLYDI